MLPFYPGMPYSPYTQTSELIADDAVTIPIVNDAVFPDAPNIATLGFDEEYPETIVYEEIDRNTKELKQVQRALEGEAKIWSAGTKIARMFTAYDHEATNTNFLALFQYETVAAVADVFTLDLEELPAKNFRLETEDADAKEVVVTNIPTETELLIELWYTEEAAITYPTGITWLGGSVPTLESGGKYRILLMTSNGGVSWDGLCVGGW